MTRTGTRAAAGALVTVLVVLGCGEPPAPVHLVPASPGDDGRGACHGLTAMGEGEYDRQVNTTVGRLATGSGQTEIADAGRILITAAAGPEGQPNTRLAIIKGQVGLANACAHIFGEGPW